jgi:tungstate transport system ATP-binding protein
MNTTFPHLEVKDLLVKRAGVTVLDIPSLSIEHGDVLGLLGPNGAGKSSLLLALARLLKVERGAILCNGRNTVAGDGAFDYRRSIAMVFQEPLLFDTTVFHNVAAGLKIRHWKGKDIQESVTRALHRFGIARLTGRDARKLSGGEAQRTSLARAFATEPGIILLDEPFSSLDPMTRESLMDDLQSVLRDTKTTAIMATHDRMEALRLSKRLAVMKDGSIVQIGSVDEVMNHPVDEFVASFVGMESILHGVVNKNQEGMMSVSIGDREINTIGYARAGDRVLCCIRPEHVTLSTVHDGEQSSARNTFAARIVKITPMGPFHRIELDCGFYLAAYITGPSLDILALKEGGEIYVSFKATAVHVIPR